MIPSPPVRSVVRAIAVLRALNHEPLSSLDMLHVRTGLPKSTIVRLLRTLESLELVRHAPQHGSYYLTSGVRSLAAGYHSEPMIVEASAPLLDALTLRLKWPAAIAVPDGDAVVVRYSTIPISPLALLHSSLGMRLSLVTRALGRAYLAFCDDEQRAALLCTLRRSEDPEIGPRRDWNALEVELERIRAQGYALREAGVRPVSNTLAVPVHQTGRLVASVGMTFFSSTVTVEQAVARFLPELRELAEGISARLAELAEEV
ncbi:DNA-binding transcriptional regulator [Verticiella sediminum]|uniref:DNA-binding transcriptional regulator n=1 Tax=Verticiella sediminum TaxID=1247510 RepID=A0A556ALS6_9BURK|nr:DNA-binding transcriptional regulator [Verticiella sediminum]TSH93815.1 DNA-binding transcriptional regulator [Verticiella sediminum]